MKVLVLGLFMIIAGCSVYPDEWRTAESMCETNGGVDYVMLDFGGVFVVCKNGMNDSF